MKNLPCSSYLSGMTVWFVDLLIYIGLIILFFTSILVSRRSHEEHSELFSKINRSIGTYVSLKAALTAVAPQFIDPTPYMHWQSLLLEGNRSAFEPTYRSQEGASSRGGAAERLVLL